MTLDDVIAHMGWQRQSLVIESLPGGITNVNYKLRAGDQAYVVRIPGEDSGRLGIDRRREHACHAAAHQAGVAPGIAAFLEEAGILVTQFIPGRQLTTEEMHRPQTLQRVAQALRQYHDGAAFPGSFSPFQTVRDYVAFSAPRGAPFPESFAWMVEQAKCMESAVGSPAALRPCHNDLLQANFIDDGRHLWIIDWEYAAMGDRFFDLGNFAVHHQLTDEEERVLLEAYFGRVTPDAVARLKLMKIISDLREAMWAMVQVTISAIDYDFVGYGRKHFDRYTTQLQDRRVPAWRAALR